MFSLAMLTSFPSIFVIIFFVLSGFFIARSLKQKRYSPLFFYGDRVIRIYIPYFGSLLVGCLAIMLAHYVNPALFEIVHPERPYNKELMIAFQNLNWESAVNAIFFLPGHKNIYFGLNGPYWSLFFEALFYIIIPFVFIIIKKYWFFILALFLHLLSFFVDTKRISILAFFLNYSLYFAMGVLLYELSSGRSSRFYLIKYTHRMTNTLVCGSLILLMMSILVGLAHFEKISFALGMLGSVLLMIWLLYGRRSAIYNSVKRVLVNPISDFLGKISFSMYLIHVPLLALMYAYWSDVSGQLVFYGFIYWIPVMFIIPMSYIFYLLFERTSLKLLDHYKKRFRQ